MVCGCAVFEHGEILARQVGDEAAVLIARNHVGADQRDAGAEGRLLRGGNSHRRRRPDTDVPLQADAIKQHRRTGTLRTFAPWLFSIMAADESFTPRDSRHAGRRRRGDARRTRRSPGAGLAADVPCVPAGPPASCSARCRYSGTARSAGSSASSTTASGLDARLDHRPVDARAQQADHAQRARVYPHRDPRGRRQSSGPVDPRHQRPARGPGGPEARRSRRPLEEDGPAPVRVFGQRHNRELRLDERGGMGRHSACRSRRAAEAVEGRDRVLVSGYDHIGQNSQRSIVGASWVFPLADLDTARRISRHPHEWRAGAGRSRQAGPARGARLVRLLVDQVGQRNPPGRTRRARDVADGGVRGTHAPERTAQVRHAITRPPTSRPPPRRCASRSARAPTASNIASSASSGAAPSRSIGCRSALATISRSRLSRSAAPKTHAMWSLWEYRWKPAKPGHLRHRARSRRSIGAAATPRSRAITCGRSKSKRSEHKRFHSSTVPQFHGFVLKRFDKSQNIWNRI